MFQVLKKFLSAITHRRSKIAARDEIRSVVRQLWRHISIDGEPVFVSALPVMSEDGCTYWFVMNTSVFITMDGDAYYTRKGSTRRVLVRDLEVLGVIVQIARSSSLTRMR